MWPFKKKVPRRRLEVRKNIPSKLPDYWERFRQAGGLGSVLIALGFYLAIFATSLWPPNPIPYQAGEYIPEDIHARVPFRMESPKLREEVQQEVAETTPASFRLNTDLVNTIISTLQAVPGELRNTTQPSEVEGELMRYLAPNSVALDAYRKYAQNPEAREEYNERLQSMQHLLEQTLVVRPDEAQAQRRRKAEKVKVLRPNEPPKQLDIKEFVTIEQNEKLGSSVIGITSGIDSAIRDGVEAYLLDLFTKGHVLYTYEEEVTRRDIQDALAAITPEQYQVSYPAGARIIRSSMRRSMSNDAETELTRADMRVLRAEHRAWQEFERNQHPLQWWGRLVGKALVYLLITVLISVYIVAYQRRIVTNHLRGFAVAGIIVLMLWVAKGLQYGLQWNSNTAVLPVLTGGIIFTIAYDRRFALAMGSVLGILTILQMQEGFPLLALLLVTLAAATFPLKEIRTRTKLIEVAAIGGLAAFLAAIAMGLADARPWSFVLVNGAWAAGSALLVGFIIQGILPAIERLFGVATSMTLLEWCDANKPLLKRLAMDAPGTYNHSLQLGTMCEAAAEAIGAQGLLARVGAYYHDVGKINKPPYFIENESGKSKHAKLSPAMSLLIITGHVKDGLELAREYGLPKVLHEFITSHHGTTLVQYFYHAATKERKENLDRAPDEVEFRYPGPKPRSREASILMLADASESSVRAMNEPTAGRIENQVHSIVQRRLMDGQLDECELTLKEVNQIEKSFVKSLCGFYHGRIAYPTPPGEKPSAAEKQAAQQKERAAAESDAEREHAELDEQTPSDANAPEPGRQAPAPR
ncbi:MAG: HD family phosphohydrolase [Phycisphaerae bacterium]